MPTQWEIKINRPQRAEARKHALAKYPLQATPYLWGEGTPDEHIVNEYKEHPEYRREYLHQLKLIRARRFS